MDGAWRTHLSVERLPSGSAPELSNIISCRWYCFRVSVSWRLCLGDILASPLKLPSFPSPFPALSSVPVSLGSSPGLYPGSCSPRCRLLREVGVMAQPVSAFCQSPTLARSRHFPAWRCPVALSWFDCSAGDSHPGPAWRGGESRGGRGGVAGAGQECWGLRPQLLLSLVLCNY